MKRWALLAGIMLSGCATEPMTDEQRAAVLQYLAARPPPPQPYVLPMPAPLPVQPVVQQAPPRTCYSTVNGQNILTNCY